MKAKEAIELMEYCDTLSCGDNPQTGFCNQFLEVIEVLQQGEKYEQMWEELMKIWFDYKADCYWLRSKKWIF